MKAAGFLVAIFPKNLFPGSNGLDLAARSLAMRSPKKCSMYSCPAWELRWWSVDPPGVGWGCRKGTFETTDPYIWGWILKWWVSPTTRVFLLKMIILGCFGGTTILVLNVKIMLNWLVVSNIVYFHPENWGRWTQFDSYFSNGLKPPASYIPGDRYDMINSHSVVFFVTSVAREYTMLFFL